MQGAFDLFGEGSNPQLFWEIGPTVGLYRLSRTTVLDLGSNKDYLKNNSSKAVPGGYFNIGRNWKEVTLLHRQIDLSYGLKISYAHRNKAIRNDYFEAGQTDATFETKQDVRDLRFTPYLAMSRPFKERFECGLSVGFGLAIKPLTHLKLYEKATNAYIGQRLSASTFSYLGEFGVQFGRKGRRGYNCKLEYLFSMGNARYQRKVSIDDADSAASVRFQDQALLIDKTAIMLPKPPKLKLRAHRFALAVSKDF